MPLPQQLAPPPDHKPLPQAPPPGAAANPSPGKSPHAKPALAKKKNRKTRKPRKSVSFSDNVVLLADDEDVQEQAPDYMAYVIKLMDQTSKTKQQQPACATESDDALDDEDDPSMSEGEELESEMTENVASVNGKVLCNLCRKRYIDPTDFYCVHCVFYMSKFQPQQEQQPQQPPVTP